MKALSKFIFLFVIVAYTSYAQSSYKQIQELVENKRYEEAGELIPQAAKQTQNDAESFVLYGDIYLELDDPASALDMYKKADDIDGGEQHILRKLAATYSMLGNTEEALETIDEAIDEDEDNPLNIVEKGMIFVRADSFQLARTLLTRAANMDKSLAAPQEALGDLYFEQEVYELSRQHYEEALSLNPKLIGARIKLATAYYWLANTADDQKISDEYFNRSLKQWNTVGKEDPKNAKAFYQQGKIFYLAGKYGSSAQAFYKYIDLRPQGWLGRWYLAQNLVNINKCDSAIVQLELVKDNIDSVESQAKLELARCYAKTENFAGAVNLYSELEGNKEVEIKLNDKTLLGNSLFRNGDTLQAFKVFEEVFEEDTTLTDLMGWLATQYLVRKDYDKAIKYFTKVVNNLPDTTEQKVKYLYYIGYSHSQSERPTEAIPPLEKAAELDSSYLKSFVALGDSYSALGRKDSAITTFSFIIERGLKDTSEYKSEVNSAFFKISSLLVKDKNYKSLNDYARDWTDFDPKSTWPWFYLALSYHGMQDKDNACRYYKKSLAMDKDNKNARSFYNKLNCAGSN